MSDLKADWGTQTQFGFTWGPMSVTRCARLAHGKRDTRVVQVKAGGRTLDIYVSRTGRSIRVFDENRKELKP